MERKDNESGVWVPASPVQGAASSASAAKGTAVKPWLERLYEDHPEYREQYPADGGFIWEVGNSYKDDEIADWRAWGTRMQQVVEYEQRHAAELESALAALAAQHEAAQVDAPPSLLLSVALKDEDIKALTKYTYDLIAWASHQKPVAAQQEAQGEPAAWMTEGGERVVTSATKAGQLRDGGASASAMRPYTVALGRIAAQEAQGGAATSTASDSQAPDNGGGA